MTDENQEETNLLYITKEGKEIKGNINPNLFKLKKGETLIVEDIF